MPLLMCPNCQASMQAVQRSNVEFDMCPNCRGVWLDRGELEKLVGLARDAEPDAAIGASARRHQDQRPRYVEPERHRDYDDDHYDSRRKKKRGFDIFDIFD